MKFNTEVKSGAAVVTSEVVSSQVKFLQGLQFAQFSRDFTYKLRTYRVSKSDETDEV
jgi:hypothetical protein